MRSPNAPRGARFASSTQWRNAQYRPVRPQSQDFQPLCLPQWIWQVLVLKPRRYAPCLVLLTRGERIEEDLRLSTCLSAKQILTEPNRFPNQACHKSNSTLRASFQALAPHPTRFRRVRFIQCRYTAAGFRRTGGAAFPYSSTLETTSALSERKA